MSDKEINAEVFKIGRRVGIKKESQQIEDRIKALGISGIIRPPYDLEQLADLYESNTWNFRCINVKAQTICGLGWRVIPASVETIDKNKNYDKLLALLEKPNPNETFDDLINKIWIDFEAMGNAYIEIAYNAAGEIAELYHVPAYTVRRMNKDTAKQYGEFVQLRDANASKVFFEAFGKNEFPKKNKIAMLRNYYLQNDYYGMPDFLAALGAIKLEQSTVDYTINFFDNSAIPAMAIVVEGGSLSAEAKRIIQDFLRDNFKGVANAHRTLYIPTTKGVTVKFEKLTQDLKYYPLAKLREHNRDEIIAAHGVPPRLVSIVAAGQLGGTSEAYYQLKIYKELVATPKQRRLESFLNRIFSMGLGVDDWKIKFNEIELNVPEEMADYVVGLKQNNIITTNEARQELGYETIEDDELDLLTFAKEVEKLRLKLEKTL